MGGGLDKATDNLIAAWHRVQDLKDATTGERHLKNGRNVVNIDQTFLPHKAS
jgi:hypothetical protein